MENSILLPFLFKEMEKALNLIWKVTKYSEKLPMNVLIQTQKVSISEQVLEEVLIL
jgi:hypothetical protein